MPVEAYDKPCRLVLDVPRTGSLAYLGRFGLAAL